MKSYWTHFTDNNLHFIGAALLIAIIYLLCVSEWIGAGFFTFVFIMLFVGGKISHNAYLRNTH